MVWIVNCTGRTYWDGIKSAETHHILTGKYYNRYTVADSTYKMFILHYEADFETVYFDWQPMIVDKTND